MPRKRKTDYDKHSDHDLLVSLNTWKDGHSKFVENTFKELKREDDTLHDRITDTRKEADTKIQKANDRIDLVKWISGVAAIIGGFIGAITSIFIKSR